jgi:hypothetical protein
VLRSKLPSLVTKSLLFWPIAMLLLRKYDF